MDNEENFEKNDNNYDEESFEKESGSNFLKNKVNLQKDDQAQTTINLAQNTEYLSNKTPSNNNNTNFIRNTNLALDPPNLQNIQLLQQQQFLLQQQKLKLQDHQQQQQSQINLAKNSNQQSLNEVQLKLLQQLQLQHQLEQQLAQQLKLQQQNSSQPNYKQQQNQQILQQLHLQKQINANAIYNLIAVRNNLLQQQETIFPNAASNNLIVIKKITIFSCHNDYDMFPLLSYFLKS